MAFVTGRAVHPSDASTEVFERIVEDKGETGGPVRHASTGQVPVGPPLGDGPPRPRRGRGLVARSRSRARPTR